MYPPDSCDSKWIVGEIVRGFTDITRLALAGKSQKARYRFDTDRLWIQDQRTRNPNMDDVVSAARKIILGS
jgi:hypothetical protein